MIRVVADQTADPSLVAIDLMAQAEHDPLATCYLVTFSTEYADQVEAAIAEHMKESTRADITTASLDNEGLIVICTDLSQAIGAVNVIAPEHLELHIANPFDALGAIRHAGAIFMGTGGANGAAGAGLLAAKAIAAVKGKKHKSGLLNRMAFGAYNKRFEGRTDFDWLTRDTEIVDKYIADPYCGYLFTVQGMADLISANAASNLQSWYTAVPESLPILLVSGAEDPVGDYGKGVQSVADGLKATGHGNVTVKLYPGCRHEVLNEKNRQEVMEDLLEWIRTVPEQ